MYRSFPAANSKVQVCHAQPQLMSMGLEDLQLP